MKSFLLKIGFLTLAFLLLLALVAGVSAAYAQGVGIGTAAPDASAALDVASDSRGFLPPRLTYAQRVGISNAAAGLLVYQSNSNPAPAAPAGYYYHTGTQWLPLQGPADDLGSHTATQNLNLTDKLLVGGPAAAPGTAGLGVTAAGVVRVGTANPPQANDRLLVDGGNLRLGRSQWRTAADDRLVKFGDGSFVSIGEAGQDDALQLTANRFTLGPGSVGIRRDLTVDGTALLGWTLVADSFTSGGNTRTVRELRCPAGMRVLGGGGGHRDANAAGSDVVLNYNGPSPAAPATGWRVQLTNTSGQNRAIRAYCICARIAP